SLIPLFLPSLPPRAPRSHSFPTRRSSDLPRGGGPGLRARGGRDLPRRSAGGDGRSGPGRAAVRGRVPPRILRRRADRRAQAAARSEEHTSELQSLTNLVCRPLLSKKNKPP